MKFGILGKNFRRDTSGNIAIMFAIGLSMIFACVGVAIDFSRLESTNNRAQSFADTAALAASRHMNASLIIDEPSEIKMRDAREIAKEMLAPFFASEGILNPKIDVKFGPDQVDVIVHSERKSAFMHMFGTERLESTVTASAPIGFSEAVDVDVILISDVTGSMQPVLTGVQSNMRNFAGDLSTELKKNNLKVGDVRTKYIFYRDYAIDNYRDWTSPYEKPPAGMEGHGAMMISDFFTLPRDITPMEERIGSVIAHGGGSIRESGLEAVAHALEQSDWRDGKETIRVIVLWTDSPNQKLHNKKENSLRLDHSYWTYDYFYEIMGKDFADLDWAAREEYMYDNYYPKDMPTNLSGLKARFDQFHNENANGFDGVETLTINVVSDCFTYSICGDWDSMGDWDGVSVHRNVNAVGSSETYELIVSQVADMAFHQALAKSVRLKY